jgi:murein DD-endopeptidase MepM/ murein hydrolase activator NlpD
MQSDENASSTEDVKIEIESNRTILNRIRCWLSLFLNHLSASKAVRERFLMVAAFAVLGSVFAIGSQTGWISVRAEGSTHDVVEEQQATDPEEQNLNTTLLPVFQPETRDFSGVQRSIDIHTEIPDRPRMDVITYSVSAGDTIFGIADNFSLKPETVLWGNYDVLQDDPHSLRPGQELNILPVDGTYYVWSEGDRLEVVAAFFGVDPQEIIDWPGNELSPDIDFDNPEIAAGTALVVPDGRREFVSWQAPRITRSNPAVARIAGPGACGSIYDGPVGEGFFVWPTTATFLSGNAYSSFHPGIDIAGSMGNAIFASASGVVVYAGWNDYGYGYMVVIDHGDGWQTLYAHMSQVNVSCGQGVFQGSVIGGVGSSGNSTGAHLHFEMQSDVYGKVNPYDFVSP